MRVAIIDRFPNFGTIYYQENSVVKWIHKQSVQTSIETVWLLFTEKYAFKSISEMSEIFKYNA